MCSVLSFHWQVFAAAKPRRAITPLAICISSKDIGTLFRATSALRAHRPGFRFTPRAAGDFHAAGLTLSEMAGYRGIQDLLTPNYFLESNEIAQATRDSDLHVSPSGVKHILAENSSFLVESRAPEALTRNPCEVTGGGLSQVAERAAQSISGRFAARRLAACAKEQLHEAVKARKPVSPAARDLR